MVGSTNPSRRRRPWAVIIAVIVVGLPAGIAAGLFLATFGRTMTEQTAWYPRDLSRLEVQEVRYSTRGIVLRIRAPAGISEVWKQTICRLSPWRPQHQRTAFRIADEKGDGPFLLLVDYAFEPGSEWLLAIRSKDGYWWSMSPYFPHEPNMPEPDWNRLVERSREVVPER